MVRCLGGNMIIKLLHMFTKIWITLVSVLILISLSFLWYSEGFAKIQEFLNPFNFANLTLTIIAFSPAFATHLLAERLENKRNNNV